MPINSTTYPSKILLFGEYLILDQAQALAIPFGQLSGAWLKSKQASSDYKAELIRLLEFLVNNGMDTFLDLAVFRTELDQGLSFDSNIPLGYGAGSSGALIAAVYDAFLKPKEQVKELELIRERLASMESFFHGKSSGLDPLVSFLKKPVWVDGVGKIKDCTIPKLDFHIYLMDSGVSRSTAPLVEIYKQKKVHETFNQLLHSQLIPHSNALVQGVLKNDSDFWSTLLEYSRLQFEMFGEMVLPSFKSSWLEGLQTEEYAMKLCGAGGGGFYLVFSQSKNVEGKFSKPLLQLI